MLLYYVTLHVVTEDPVDIILSVVLTIQDLNEIKSILIPFKRLWYHIGVKLNIDMAKMDLIRELHEDDEVCLLEMVKEWLTSTKATRQKLFKALTIVGSCTTQADLTMKGKGVLLC